jgi:photosystem II stability/assembly factor-like uncharacterized protein
MIRFISAVLLVVPTAFAATWTSHGPHNGFVHTIVSAPSNPRVLYAGYATGVFRSDDGGDRWIRIGGALRNVSLLAADPRDANVVYAAAGAQIFKTLDGGSRWFDISDGLPAALAPTALLVDPLDPNTLYVGSNCGAIFKTRPEYHEAAGVYKSIDGGRTWKQVLNGSLSTLDFCIEELSLDPLIPSHLYSAAPLSSAGAESFDGGLTWSRVQAPIPSRAIVNHPQFPLIRYGIGELCPPRPLVTNDAGFTWTPAAGGGLPTSCDPKSFSALTIDLSVGRLFLGTFQGLFRSGNGGESWLPIGSIPAVPVPSAVFNAADSQVIAGTAQGIYRVPSPAFTPSTLLEVNDGATGIRRLVVDRNKAGTIYAASRDVDPGAEQGRIFRSRDSGASWSVVGDSRVVGGLSIGLAIGPQGDLYSTRLLEKIVYRLPAGSDEWVALPRSFGSVDTIAADPQIDGTLYLAADLMMYRSRDFGMTWELLTGLNLQKGESTGTYSIVVDSRGAVYDATVGQGLWKSDDRGDHWMQIERQSVATFRLEVSPADERTLYRYARDLGAAELPFLFWQSTDGGAAWSSSRIPGNDVITGIAPDVRDANTVWITTANQGAFRSTDGGKTWVAPPDGLPTRSVSDVAVDSAGVVHVGTFEQGVWELRATARSRPISRR